MVKLDYLAFLFFKDSLNPLHIRLKFFELHGRIIDYLFIDEFEFFTELSDTYILLLCSLDSAAMLTGIFCSLMVGQVELLRIEVSCSFFCDWLLRAMWAGFKL
jgi:hypothetical protein